MCFETALAESAIEKRTHNRRLFRTEGSGEVRITHELQAGLVNHLDQFAKIKRLVISESAR